MGENTEDDLATRRFAAEREDLRLNYELKREELTIRREELTRNDRGRYSATTTAIVAAVCSLLSASLVAFIGGSFTVQARVEQNRGEIGTQAAKATAELDAIKQKGETDIKLQRERFEAETRQKEQERQFQLILKVTENRSQQDAAKNLLFFVDVGFLPDPNGRIRNKASKQEAPVVKSEALEVKQYEIERQSTEILRAFVFPNAQLNMENRLKLESYLASKGIPVDVSSFMRLERFSKERREAIRALGLSE